MLERADYSKRRRNDGYVVPCGAGLPTSEQCMRRADHLASVHIPMLFLQGTRDALADPGLLEPMLTQLGERATLATFDGADHAFHVRRRSGLSDELVLHALADRAAEWMSRIVSGETA